MVSLISLSPKTTSYGLSYSPQNNISEEKLEELINEQMKIISEQKKRNLRGFAFGDGIIAVSLKNVTISYSKGKIKREINFVAESRSQLREEITKRGLKYDSKKVKIYHPNETYDLVNSD